MNDDSLELARMISNIHVDLKNDFGELKAEVSGMKGTFTTDIAATKFRVSELEAENVRQGWKDWLDRGILATIILGIHKGLTMLGWKI
jgi:hypothetical protein